MQRTRKSIFVISTHAGERLEQRSIRQVAIQIAIEWGEWFYAGKNCEVAYLSRRALRFVKASLGIRITEIENLAVVVANDGTILTAYRTKRPLKHWRGDR